jgi:threonine dehydrogenase-like Zn-dependent dehydrogenase
VVFGSEKLDGGQAEFVRVPLADGTVFQAPQGISDKALILMADIFPTGYFGVKSAMELCPTVNVKESTMVVIGCGPVGLCAIVCALHFQPKHLFAVDSVDSRLQMASKLGAQPLNFKDGIESMQERIRQVTDGRGADMVVEVVGLSPALRTAYELARPFGAISSIGVHNAEVCHYRAESRLQS